MVIGEIFQTDGVHAEKKPYYERPARYGISVCLAFLFLLIFL